MIEASELVVVLAFPQAEEGLIAQGLLERAGVWAQQAGTRPGATDSVTGTTEAGDVRLLIRAVDVNRARAILTGAEAQHATAPACPRCGSRAGAEPPRAVAFGQSLFNLALFRGRRDPRCPECGRTATMPSALGSNLRTQA